mgnify:CR=1 FL=1
MLSKFLLDKTTIFLRKLPLTVILTVPFVVQILVIVSLIGYFSLRSGNKAVNNVTPQLREELIQIGRAHV